MLLIAPVVVDEDGQNVLAASINIRCQVEAEGHHAILTPPQFLAVEEAAGTEAHALKLDEELLGGLQFLGQHKMLAIPRHGVCQLVDSLGIGFRLVERVRQRHRLPCTIVIADSTGLRMVAHQQSPPGVEIKPFASPQMGGERDCY